MRILSGVFTLILFLMLAAGGMLALLYHQFEAPGPLTASRVITVPRGEGRIEIATRLEKEGAISNRWAFIANYLLRNAIGPKQTELKAGDYEIKKHASMAEIMETLALGRGVLSKITIPEGWTSLQIVQRLREEEELVGEITEIPPEGSLLPDTYRYSKGMDRRELLERMQSEMQRLLAAEWERRQPSLPITTPEEALVFASIVEKETGRADERGRVASVFMNRLRKGMRLQSDPTVIYGIAGGQGSLGRPITRADLDQKTAHNTYQIGGLPPTPICNPGRSAIEASLDPPKTNDLYFVADGTGGHTFSDTLKDHNAAVSVWRKVERERKKDAAAASNAAPGTGGAGEDAIPTTGSEGSEDLRVINSAAPAKAPGATA
ncbi:MAG TPA: endolytic transglycosylase MltG, partial [Hyphomicrobium sp.]|nr:endolytic transglycosylase MltG [Hyphomicrobium sp.]